MPQTIPTADLAKKILYLLTETFESPIKDGNAYLDRGTGVFMTLAAVSAEDASRPAFPGATTVAAQTEHLRFYLVALEGFITGAHTSVNWKESWRLTRVTPEQWDALRAELRRSYDHTVTLIEGFNRWDEDELGGTLSMLVHSAYHLGALRQLLKALA
jgi:hypothetical protein